MRASRRGDQGGDLPPDVSRKGATSAENAQAAPEAAGTFECDGPGWISPLCRALASAKHEIAYGLDARVVEALDLLGREASGGTAAHLAHELLPAIELLDQQERAEDALVRAEREQRAFHDATDEIVEVARRLAQHDPQEAPGSARLRRIEARFPVYVPQADRVVALDEMHGYEVVVRVYVTDEVRQIAVRERTFARRASRACDLPADPPAVAVRVDAAGVALRVHDVRGDAAIKIRCAMGGQDLLKGGWDGAKRFEQP